MLETGPGGLNHHILQGLKEEVGQIQFGANPTKDSATICPQDLPKPSANNSPDLTINGGGVCQLKS